MFLSLFRYLEFLFRTENGVKLPVWVTTVQNRGRVFTNSSPASRGGLETVSHSLGTSRTGRILQQIEATGWPFQELNRILNIVPSVTPFSFGPSLSPLPLGPEGVK